MPRHQTGWTGLVADLICRPDPFETYSFGEDTQAQETHVAT